MGQDTPDVVIQEPKQTDDNLSNDAMDSFMKEAQAEEASYDEGQPTNQEETSDEVLREERLTEEPDASSERPSENAELSSEEGRDERSTEQVPSDESSSEERHQQSYKVALKEEREYNKQLRQDMQKELQDQREAAKQLSEAMGKMVETPKTPIPSYDDDPIGNMKANLDVANERIKALSDSGEKVQQDLQQQSQQQQFMGNYQSKVDEFRQDNPDFNKAYAHLTKEMQQDYVAQGMSVAEANKALVQDELRMVDQQMRNNNDPAKVLYDLAKRRGYDPDAAAKVEKVGRNTEEGLQKLERMERGVKASRSMNNRGVSPRTTMPTPEEMNMMSEKEFDSFDWDDYVKNG